MPRGGGVAIKSVSVKLKRLRANQRLTQEALARKANVSLGYLARLETGQHDPKLSTLHKIAKALGVRVADLL